jgi:hypothetical protein
MTEPSTPTDTTRALSSGHSPAADEVRLSSTKNPPSAAPATTASTSGWPKPRCDSGAGSVRPSRLTRYTAVTAMPMPMSAGSGGCSPSQADDHGQGGAEQRGHRGDDAHRSSRQRPVEEDDAAAAERSGQPAVQQVDRQGRRGRQQGGRRSASTSPTRWANSVTVMGDVRRAATPPKKSAVP